MEQIFTIEAALSSDKAPLINLLTETSLTHEGVSEHFAGFVAARDESGQFVGCASVEHYGNIGLLRSVAVSLRLQKSGLSSRLVSFVINEAKKNGIEEIVLLTMTARDFFAKHFHFTETEREHYDETLRDSPEWTLPRCSSAVVMKLAL